MEELRSTVHDHFPSLVLLSVASGFVMVLAELLLMGHDEGKQIIAIGASIVGAIAAGCALFASNRIPGALAIALLAVGATGLLGTVFHVAEALEHAGEGKRDRQEAGVLGARAHAAEDMNRNAGEAGRDVEGEEGPPPLAPLSMTGLGVLGALGTLARKGKNEG